MHKSGYREKAEPQGTGECAAGTQKRRRIRINGYGTTKGNHFDDQWIDRNTEGRAGRLQAGCRGREGYRSQGAVSASIHCSGQNSPANCRRKLANSANAIRKTDSSTTGAMHRAWINLKSALTSGDDHAILAECERGEDSAISEYKEAMENGLDANVRADCLAPIHGSEKRARPDQAAPRRDEVTEDFDGNRFLQDRELAVERDQHRFLRGGQSLLRGRPLQAQTGRDQRAHQPRAQ